MPRDPELPMTPSMDMIPHSTRKPKKKRPTQRTLEKLRDDGHEVQVVEKWVACAGMPGGGIRRDLFGCIDVIAIMDNQIVGIQCGADSGHSGHKKKCLAEPRLLTWLRAGGRFFIHSWGARKIGKQKRWLCRIEELTEGSFVTTGDLFV